MIHNLDNKKAFVFGRNIPFPQLLAGGGRQNDPSRLRGVELLRSAAAEVVDNSVWKLEMSVSDASSFRRQVGLLVFQTPPGAAGKKKRRQLRLGE